jgi:Tol biopolymer transport system component
MDRGVIRGVEIAGSEWIPQRARAVRRRSVALALVAALGTLAAGFGSACREMPAKGGTSASDGLVYIRTVGGSTDVMRLRISDGAVRAVTANREREERWPYWSDGARRLVFQVGDPDQPRGSNLVLWDPETDSETKLPTAPGRSERWPGWSPDGRSLVYAFLGGQPESGVALMDLRARKTAVIARSGSGSRNLFLRPNFSPDGRLLVAQRRIPGRGADLWILSPAERPRRLVIDPDWHDTKAWFTRDGSRIVYSRRPAAGGNFDVLSVAVGGGDQQTILGSEASEHSARPSPTRDEIVLVSDRDGSSDIFLAGLDGGSLRNLGRTPDRNEMTPRWSPDGERIVATAVPAAVADFGTMNAAAVEHARLVVFDRDGNELLDTPGAMADWMPPWQ